MSFLDRRSLTVGIPAVFNAPPDAPRCRHVCRATAPRQDALRMSTGRESPRRSLDWRGDRDPRWAEVLCFAGRLAIDVTSEREVVACN